jgi:putative NAD(P)H nitroreductase
MHFSDILKNRRACHHFLPDQAIPKEDLEKMVQAASTSPSGYNAQPWEFIVIRSKEQIKKMHELSFKQHHILNAGALIIVLADKEIGRHVDKLLDDWISFGYIPEEERFVYHNSIAKNRSEEKRKTMALRNAMLASMTLIYAAEDLGYATCPMMAFSQHEVRKLLHIPDDREIALFIAIGKADKEKALPPLPRKKVEELIHWEEFGY